MGIVFEDDKLKPESGSLRPLDHHILRRVRRFAEHFAELAMKSWDFLLYQPSIVAISCILSARMASSICPLWSDKLAEMTNYDFVSNPDLIECFEKLYSLYDENFKPTRELFLTKI